MPTHGVRNVPTLVSQLVLLAKGQIQPFVASLELAARAPRSRSTKGESVTDDVQSIFDTLPTM